MRRIPSQPSGEFDSGLEASLKDALSSSVEKGELQAKALNQEIAKLDEKVRETFAQNPELIEPAFMSVFEQLIADGVVDFVSTDKVHAMFGTLTAIKEMEESAMFALILQKDESGAVVVDINSDTQIKCASLNAQAHTLMMQPFYRQRMANEKFVFKAQKGLQSAVLTLLGYNLEAENAFTNVDFIKAAELLCKNSIIFPSNLKLNKDQKRILECVRYGAKLKVLDDGRFLVKPPIAAIKAFVYSDDFRRHDWQSGFDSLDRWGSESSVMTSGKEPRAKIRQIRRGIVLDSNGLRSANLTTLLTAHLKQRFNNETDYVGYVVAKAFANNMFSSYLKPKEIRDRIKNFDPEMKDVFAKQVMKVYKRKSSQKLPIQTVLNLAILTEDQNTEYSIPYFISRGFEGVLEAGVQSALDYLNNSNANFNFARNGFDVSLNMKSNSYLSRDIVFFDNELVPVDNIMGLSYMDVYNCYKSICTPGSSRQIDKSKSEKDDAVGSLPLQMENDYGIRFAIVQKIMQEPRLSMDNLVFESGYKVLYSDSSLDIHLDCARNEFLDKLNLPEEAEDKVKKVEDVDKDKDDLPDSYPEAKKDKVEASKDKEGSSKDNAKKKKVENKKVEKKKVEKKKVEKKESKATKKESEVEKKKSEATKKESEVKKNKVGNNKVKKKEAENKEVENKKTEKKKAEKKEAENKEVKVNPQINVQKPMNKTSPDDSSGIGNMQSVLDLSPPVKLVFKTDSKREIDNLPALKGQKQKDLQKAKDLVETFTPSLDLDLSPPDLPSIPAVESIDCTDFTADNFERKLTTALEQKFKGQKPKIYKLLTGQKPKTPSGQSKIVNPGLIVSRIYQGRRELVFVAFRNLLSEDSYSPGDSSGDSENVVRPVTASTFEFIKQHFNNSIFDTGSLFLNLLKQGFSIVSERSSQDPIKSGEQVRLRAGDNLSSIFNLRPKIKGIAMNYGLMFLKTRGGGTFDSNTQSPEAVDYNKDLHKFFITWLDEILEDCEDVVDLDGAMEKLTKLYSFKKNSREQIIFFKKIVKSDDPFFRLNELQVPMRMEFFKSEFSMSSLHKKTNIRIVKEGQDIISLLSFGDPFKQKPMMKLGGKIILYKSKAESVSDFALKLLKFGSGLMMIRNWFEENYDYIVSKLTIDRKVDEPVFIAYFKAALNDPTFKGAPFYLKDLKREDENSLILFDGVRKLKTVDRKVIVNASKPFVQNLVDKSYSSTMPEVSQAPLIEDIVLLRSVFKRSQTDLAVTNELGALITKRKDYHKLFPSLNNAKAAKDFLDSFKGEFGENVYNEYFKKWRQKTSESTKSQKTDLNSSRGEFLALDKAESLNKAVGLCIGAKEWVTLLPEIGHIKDVLGKEKVKSIVTLAKNDDDYFSLLSNADKIKDVLGISQAKVILQDAITNKKYFALLINLDVIRSTYAKSSYSDILDLVNGDLPTSNKYVREFAEYVKASQLEAYKSLYAIVLDYEPGFNRSALEAYSKLKKVFKKKFNVANNSFFFSLFFTNPSEILDKLDQDELALYLSVIRELMVDQKLQPLLSFSAISLLGTAHFLDYENLVDSVVSPHPKLDQMIATSLIEVNAQNQVVKLNGKAVTPFVLTPGAVVTIAENYSRLQLYVTGKNYSIWNSSTNDNLSGNDFKDACDEFKRIVSVGENNVGLEDIMHDTDGNVSFNRQYVSSVKVFCSTFSSKAPAFKKTDQFTVHSSEKKADGSYESYLTVKTDTETLILILTTNAAIKVQTKKQETLAKINIINIDETKMFSDVKQGVTTALLRGFVTLSHNLKKIDRYTLIQIILEHNLLYLLRFSQNRSALKPYLDLRFNNGKVTGFKTHPLGEWLDMSESTRVNDLFLKKHPQLVKEFSNLEIQELLLEKLVSGLVIVVKDKTVTLKLNNKSYAGGSFDIECKKNSDPSTLKANPWVLTFTIGDKTLSVNVKHEWRGIPYFVPGTTSTFKAAKVIAEPAKFGLVATNGDIAKALKLVKFSLQKRVIDVNDEAKIWIGNNKKLASKMDLQKMNPLLIVDGKIWSNNRFRKIPQIKKSTSLVDLSNRNVLIMADDDRVLLPRNLRSLIPIQSKFSILYDKKSPAIDIAMQMVAVGMAPVLKYYKENSLAEFVNKYSFEQIDKMYQSINKIPDSLVKRLLASKLSNLTERIVTTISAAHGLRVQSKFGSKGKKDGLDVFNFDPSVMVFGGKSYFQKRGYVNWDRRARVDMVAGVEYTRVLGLLLIRNYDESSDKITDVNSDQYKILSQFGVFYKGVFFPRTVAYTDKRSAKFAGGIPISMYTKVEQKGGRVYLDDVAVKAVKQIDAGKAVILRSKNADAKANSELGARPVSPRHTVDVQSKDVLCKSSQKEQLIADLDKYFIFTGKIGNATAGKTVVFDTMSFKPNVKFKMIGAQKLPAVIKSVKVVNKNEFVLNAEIRIQIIK